MTDGVSEFRTVQRIEVELIHAMALQRVHLLDGDGRHYLHRYFDPTARAIDGLTTLDVTTTESQLAAFLSSLDRARLRVQSSDALRRGNLLSCKPWRLHLTEYSIILSSRRG